MPKPLRIVAVGDTHTFENFIPDVPDGDIFVHVGDFCRSGSLAELECAIEWVKALPHRHKVTIAGNHDVCIAEQRNASLELFGDSIVYLEDSGLTIEGVRFWGSPWQPEFCNWAFNLPRGLPLAEKWSLIPKETDVLITHGPPYGFGDRVNDDERLGCQDLIQAVRNVRPLLHLFGHIHEDGGYWFDDPIAFANVTSCGPCRAASVIDLDLKARSVVPIVIPDRFPEIGASET